MHPPSWNQNHRLMDWPDCCLDLHCACGYAVVYACKLLATNHGNRTFADIVPRLRCQRCGNPPPAVYLVAGFHRTFGAGGPPPDWSLPLVFR
jgi:hypothetical protein